MASQAAILSPSQPTGWHSLPAELRLEIYKHTWESRNVTIDSKQEMDFPDHVPLKLWVYSRPPVTLHLNSEARYETLRHYRPFFSTESNVTYFNPSLDVLVLSFFPGTCEPYTPNWRDMPGSQPFLNALALARHIVYTGPKHEFLTDEVQRVQRKRFAAIRTIDVWVMLPHRNGSWSWVWNRKCCIPGCTAPKVPDFPTYRPWREHMLKHCGSADSITAQELAFRDAVPFRPCLEVSGGLETRQVMAQARGEIDEGDESN